MNSKEITVKNLDKFTPQQVFDFVTHKIIEQGQKSGQDMNLCNYRSKGGLKCAAGHLIPDDLYTPKLEGKDYNKVREYLGINDTHLCLIEDLQAAHDGAKDDFFVQSFISKAAAVADTHCLDSSRILKPWEY